MKGIISIFALPQEIDNLHTTLYNLRRNVPTLSSEDSFGFDITLCLSDELTDWNGSVLPKSYFEDKFNQITEKLCSWAVPESVKIEYGNSILGCVSQRRHSLKFLNTYDFTLWLDTDLFFNDYFLSYVAASTKVLAENNIDQYVITPQITRQWDMSWDVLVNKALLSREFNDNVVADVFELGLSDFGKVDLISIPHFKGAGGWGTVISNNLLKITGIPESLGHYGLEDTYVLTCASILQKMNYTTKPQQFVMENMLVCENHRFQTSEYLRNSIKSFDKKDEFRHIATQNFNTELNKFVQRVTA
jgi:hypothetical protein